MDNKTLKNEEKIKKLEQAQLRAIKAEERELFFDFDKAIEEKGTKPLSIKFQNKYIDIPGEMPFDFSMFFFRKCMFRDNDGIQQFQVLEDDIVEFITLMFGNEFLATLEKSRISIKMVFEELAMKILKKWGYGIETDFKKDAIQKKI